MWLTRAGNHHANDSYIHTYIHTCIHTYMHTHMHTCMHTYIHTLNRAGPWPLDNASTPLSMRTRILNHVHICLHKHSTGLQSRSSCQVLSGYG